MMKKKNQGGSPSGLPHLTKVELTKKNLPLRITLLVLALIIAFVAFGYGISSLLNEEPGWNEIKAAAGQTNCSQDFILNYYLGRGELSASAESKQLSTLYTKLTVDAYQLFSSDYASDSVHNICYINGHFNEDITVEPAVYEALSAVVRTENRSIYLAPAYTEYQRLFLCDSDGEAALYDPSRNPELADYITEICAFAADPEMIDIQLLGEQRIRLNVSEAYLDFAAENEIESFLDFSWMTNAFIADYIAGVLIDNGFTRGYLASYDGFTRNLWTEGDTFGLNVFHRVGNDIFMPASLQYPGGRSIVALRDFPLNEADRWHYYTFGDGRIASILLDPVTGQEKCAVSSLIGYSDSVGCAEVLLAMAPLYLADTLDTQSLNALTGRGIYALYPEGTTVYCNDPDAVIRLNKDLSYTLDPIT